MFGELLCNAWRHLLLPTSAERLVDLDERQTLVEPRLDEVQFRREMVRLAGEDLQITGAAVLIKYFGQLVGLLRRLREQVLLLAELVSPK